MEETPTPAYELTEADFELLEKRFTYHPPKPGQTARYIRLRALAKLLATSILVNCPPSRERSTAITHLEEAIMWANASIARNE